MNDVWLVVLGVVLGAVLGVGIKAIIDPLLDARGRKIHRRETQLEDAVEHKEQVLLHIQKVRSESTTALRFDGDLIARAILRTLTPEFGPGPLKPVAGRPYPPGLTDDVNDATEAWMAVRLATMDDQHGAEAAEESMNRCMLSSGTRRRY